MYHLSDSAMSTRVDDETILLDSEGGKYFGINRTGTKMLDAILATGDMDATVHTLSAEYGVEPGRIRKDLEKFLATLIERGLIAMV
jgi:hypothetical protein